MRPTIHLKQVLWVILATTVPILTPYPFPTESICPSKHSCQHLLGSHLVGYKNETALSSQQSLQHQAKRQEEVTAMCTRYGHSQRAHAERGGGYKNTDVATQRTALSDF